MHRIEITTEKPIQLRTYRTTYAARAEIQRQTDEMLQMRTIQESESPWSAPVLLVKIIRRTKILRRLSKLINVNVNIYQEFPTMDDILDCLADRQLQIFSSLDLKQGYWQEPIEPESRPKSAFSTHQGHFEFARMSFAQSFHIHPNDDISFTPHTIQVFSRVFGRYLGLQFKFDRTYESLRRSFQKTTHRKLAPSSEIMSVRIAGSALFKTRLIKKGGEGESVKGLCRERVSQAHKFENSAWILRTFGIL